jgi:hypothetical protein
VSTHGKSVVWIVIVKIVKIKKVIQICKKKVGASAPFFSFIWEFSVFLSFLVITHRAEDHPLPLSPPQEQHPFCSFKFVVFV